MVLKGLGVIDEANLGGDWDTAPGMDIPGDSDAVSRGSVISGVVGEGVVAGEV